MTFVLIVDSDIIDYAFRTADKTRYDDMLAHVKADIQSVSQKLMVAESKKRFREQSERDDNMIVESVSRVEHNYVVSELESAKMKQAASELELIEKKMTIEQLNSEIQLKIMDLLNLDRKTATLEQRLDLATQAKDHFQKKQEEAIAAYEQKLVGLREELDKERKDLADSSGENSRLKDEQSTLKDQLASFKRENDEYFRFLHKAEEDNKMLRAMTNDLQAKLGPALADKEEIERKLSMKAVELSAAQTEVDTVKGQLWKVINTTKSFSKAFTRTLTSNPIEEKLALQQRRLENTEVTMNQLKEKLLGLAKHRDAIMRDFNKEKMMRQFAEANASSPGLSSEDAETNSAHHESHHEMHHGGSRDEVESRLSDAAAPASSEGTGELQLELDRLKRSEAKKTCGPSLRR